MDDVERRADRVLPTLASARVRTTATALGFTNPPVLLRLKIFEGPHHWSMFVQPQPGARIGDLVEWLEPWSPLRIEFGSRQVLRADFDPLPSEWRRVLRSLELQMLILHPGGTAIASVTGTHAALAGFGHAQTRNAAIKVREVRDAPRDVPLLTTAQDEALRAAVQAGYYRIPRPLNLKDLAAKLDISSASLSERLRRAEGRIILRYTNEGATTPWDARTIFGAHAAPGQRAEDDEAQSAFWVPT